MWEKIKNWLAIIGGAAIAIIAAILGRNLPDNGDGANRVREDIERSKRNNRRAAEDIERVESDNRQAAEHTDDAIRNNRDTADDNQQARTIIQRIRDRGPS